MACTFLFLFYIIDFTYGISNNKILFADDTFLYAIIDHDVIKQILLITIDIIRNLVEYGDVWDNYTKQNSELLEKVHIKAARIIARLRVDSS